MTLVERYVFRIARTAFVASLGVLVAVIWLTTALREFDLLTSKGQTILTFLAVTALTIPSLVAIISPVALFIAVVYALNKLNGDSELIVMSAAGLSPGRLLRPFVVLTLLATLLAGAMSLYVMPWSFHELRDLITKIRADFITNVVREGTFTTLDSGFMFHYRSRGPDGSLKSILMEDRRDPAHVSTYMAETGQTVQIEDNSFLVLSRGNVQRRQPKDRSPAIVVFDRYALDLDQLGGAGAANMPLKPRERSTSELMNLDPQDRLVQLTPTKFKAELHDRLVSPLYTVAFGMIGFAALSRARTTRQSRGASILGAVAAVLGIRLAGFGVSSLVVKNTAWIPLTYAVPLAGVVLAGLAVTGVRMPTFKRRTYAVLAPNPA